MSIVCQSGSFCPRHQRVVNGRRWMAQLTLASEGWPGLVSPLAAQQALQSYQSDSCWFKSRQFYFNSTSLDEKSFLYCSYLSSFLPIMQVLYILSCCWISPDPDAAFICYLKMTWCYLQRHCLLPDMRHQLSGKTWGWNISSTEYPVPHEDVTFIVPLSPLALFFCFSCHQGQDNQIFCFAYNMGCAVTFIEVLWLHPNFWKKRFFWCELRQTRLLLEKVDFYLHFTSQFLSCQGVCGDFLEGACDLSENNILDHNRYTDTPAECQAREKKTRLSMFSVLVSSASLSTEKVNCTFFQDLCSQNAQCHFFTHFSTQCYLLVECGDSEQYENIIIILSSSFFTKNLSWPFPFSCTGCVSGPTSPAFGSCPWPPSEYFSSSFYLSLSFDLWHVGQVLSLHSSNSISSNCAPATAVAFKFWFCALHQPTAHAHNLFSTTHTLVRNAEIALPKTVAMDRDETIASFQ